MSQPVTCLALMTDAYGGHGGIAQYNRDLISAMSEIEEIGRIEVAPRHAPGDLGRLPKRVWQHRARAGRLDYAWNAWRVARRMAPDLVFCGHLHLAPLAAAVAWRCGALLVVQTHGIEVWSRPSHLRRRAVEAADLVMAVSRDTRARVLGWANLAPEQVRVAPNTVADDYQPGDGHETRLRLGLSDKFAILTVGRLAAAERYKGHDRVIELLPGLAAEGHDVTYLIAGDGDDRPRLERLATEVGAAAQVMFLGRVKRQELPDLYRAADLFVLPSTGEGFGIVLLEAMACGTPALGLSVGGAVDALAEGALGCATDLDHFAAALSHAVRSPRKDPDLPARVRTRFGRPAFEAHVRRVLTPLLTRPRAA